VSRKRGYISGPDEMVIPSITEEVTEATSESPYMDGVRKYDAEAFNPNWCIRPGHTLNEWRREQNLTQRQLAAKLGISTKHMNQIMTGKATYSPNVAIKLAQVTGVSAWFWYRLQADWVIARAQGKKDITEW
jgi:addiction module HigA family antidote